MMGKRKAPSSSSTPPGQKAKGPRQDSGAADGSLPERRSFVHGSAFLIVCFACFLLGFRLSWEGKAAFLGAYRIGPESGKLVLRDTGTSLDYTDYADSESGGGTKQGGLDLRPGAWESGQGDKYGAGVADGEWERIETRILASAGGVVNASASNRSRRLLPRPPPSPPEHPWVGRHNISVRPWPHPDAGETLLAHALIAAVQREQQNQFGVPLDRRKRVIVVTPTYRRAFQQIHLSHLTDTLRLAPEPLSWLVVEAGGPTEETQAILSKTGLADIHLLPVPGVTMPDVRAPERPIVEDYLRDVALGYIQKQAMEGIVIFADDSATLRLALFQELQKVRWFAAFSVGMLVQGGGSQVDLPVQGPVCGPEGDVRGWHAADHELLRLKKLAVVPKRALLGIAEQRSLGGEGARRRLLALEVPERIEGSGAGSNSISQVGAGPAVRRLQQVEQSEYFEPEQFIPKLEWVGFAFNARLLWAPAERPAWLREWKPLTALGKVDAVVGDYEGDEDPTDLLARMVEDESQVETLGRCGKDVLAWWLRVEAAEEGQYPAGWRLGENLPVVAEPQEWSEEQWAEYETRLVEEKKKKKKKKSKKKKKAPEATKVEEDAAARQAAEQAAADEARRVEEEKQRELEQEAARQAEEERQTRLAEAQKAEVEDKIDSVQKAQAEVRTGPEKEGEKAESKLESSALEEKEALTKNAKEVLKGLAEGANGGVADDTQARGKQTSER